MRNKDFSRLKTTRLKDYSKSAHIRTPICAYSYILYNITQSKLTT